MAEQSSNPAYLFDSYFGPSVFQPWARRLIDAADLKPGEAVLDLACATGTVARIIGAGGQNRVVGLDFSPKMLEVARSTGQSQGLEIEWLEGSADSMPFDDASFDLVICQHGLQFFPDRVGAAREVYRVLKPGGRLVANVWQGVERQSLWGVIFETVSNRLNVPMSEAALPFMMGDEDELRKYVLSGGFSAVEITEQTMETRFSQPEKFVQLSVTAAGASIPTFAAMEQETRETVIAEIVDALASQVDDYIEDGHVVTPTVLNQAIAFK